jgi:hypothetical protein
MGVSSAAGMIATPSTDGTPRRRGWAIWLTALVAFVAVVLWPISNTWTRGAATLLLVGTILGLIALCSRQRALRLVLAGALLFVAVFLALPARQLPPPEILEADVIAALERYEGVRYVWGGEGPLGIDGSGLMRRGLIDALFLRGVRSLDPGLVRTALRHWWHDTSAEALGEAHAGMTVAVQESPSVNVMGYNQLQPADLVVTNDGVHVMALLREGTWIEADPIVGRVIKVEAPASDHAWFTQPVRSVRCKVLAWDPDPLLEPLRIGSSIPCDFAYAERNEVSPCADRMPDGTIVVRREAMARAGVKFPNDGVGEALIDHQLYFVTPQGRTAPAKISDNGADYFVEGLARTVRNGKIGFVNIRLDEVIPPQWDFASSFDDGVAHVGVGGALHYRGWRDEHGRVVGTRWGIIDRSGKLVVPVQDTPDGDPSMPANAPSEAGG